MTNDLSSAETLFIWHVPLLFLRNVRNRTKRGKKKEESVFYGFHCFLINFWSQESKNVHWQFHTLLHLLFAFITCMAGMAVFINGKHKHK